MNKTTWVVVLGTAVLASSACSGEDSLGKKNSGGTVLPSSAPLCHSGGGGSGGSLGFTGTLPPSWIGTWVGYAENYKFDSGSDAVVLVLDGTAGLGFVVLGNGSEPAPASDPNLGYPPGFVTGAGGAPGSTIYEGFHYRLLAGELGDPRLKTRASTQELWRTWCPLQTAYDRSPGCGCLPDWGHAEDPYPAKRCYQTDPASHEQVDVDCGKVGLCDASDPVCRCTAQGCTVDLETNLRFDLTRYGDVLMGSLETPLSGTLTVKLTRE